MKKMFLAVSLLFATGDTRGIMRKLAIALFLAAACAKTEAPPAAGSAAAPLKTISITGAGATFPYPIYSKWFSDYNKLHPNVQVNYQSIGSGGGIKQITEKTVDFGASDAILNDDQYKAAQGIQMFPTVAGEAALAVNLLGDDG